MGSGELTGHQCEASTGGRTTPRVAFDARVTRQLPSVPTRLPSASEGGSHGLTRLSQEAGRPACPGRPRERGCGTGGGHGVGCGGHDLDPGRGQHPPHLLGKIDPESGLQAATGTLGYVTGPVAGLKPNPLAGTGVDPLDNGIGTDLADFKPMTSQALTGPVAQAQSIGSIPVVGQAAGLQSQQ